MAMFRCGGKNGITDFVSKLDYPTGNSTRTVEFSKEFKTTPNCLCSSTMGSVKVTSVTTSNVTYTISGSGTMRVNVFAYVE